MECQLSPTPCATPSAPPPLTPPRDSRPVLRALLTSGVGAPGPPTVAHVQASKCFLGLKLAS